MKKIKKNSLEELKNSINEKIFVVRKRYNSRTSDYGKLLEINEGVNIVLENPCISSSWTTVPINNQTDKILKIYNKQGIVVYDAE